MSTFDRIEEHRDLVAGLEYEEWWNTRTGDEKLDWRNDVIARDAACVVYREHDCGGALECHHVVTQQHLRKHGLDHARWDRRIGVTVCERAHRRHTLAVERIPLDALPHEVVSFVEELGLGWYLERYYGAAA